MFNDIIKHELHCSLKITKKSLTLNIPHHKFTMTLQFTKYFFKNQASQIYTSTVLNLGYIWDSRRQTVLTISMLAKKTVYYTVSLTQTHISEHKCLSKLFNKLANIVF